jgi:hypothetical protein
MVDVHVYDEIVDFIAGSNPQQVLTFKASESTNLRVGELLEKERESLITPAEKKELDHYLMLEHIMRLAKAKARILLKTA